MSATYEFASHDSKASKKGPALTLANPNTWRVSKPIPLLQ